MIWAKIQIPLRPIERHVLCTEDWQPDILLRHLLLSCMTKPNGVRVSLGFYPEKAQDSETQQHTDFNAQQIFVPDKKNPLLPGR